MPDATETTAADRSLAELRRRIACSALYEVEMWAVDLQTRARNMDSDHAYAIRGIGVRLLELHNAIYEMVDLEVSTFPGKEGETIQSAAGIVFGGRLLSLDDDVIRQGLEQLKDQSQDVTGREEANHA